MKPVSAWGGHFILSNAASWSILSDVFLLIRPSRASFSSTYRQRQTWIWLQYAESAQETSRRTKYGHEASIKRNLRNECSTGRYSNPAELICKTIEHVIRISYNNTPGVQGRGTQPHWAAISIVWRRSNTKENAGRKQWKAAWRWNEPPYKNKSWRF